jgi:MYXO-CTERM domain-containing protein
VAADTAPPAPVVVTPRSDLCVPTPFPPLVVTNAVDPDGDALVYFFQVDSDPGFQSADLEESGPIPQGYGETSWIPTRELVDGGSYVWRAWVSDGLLESEPATELLSVCVPDSGDGGDDGYSYDNGMDDYSSERGAPSGCGCMPDPADSDAADAGILGVLAFVGLPRRRRPRTGR